MVHPGAYRGNKRQKELKRLQKQEEKRQRRMHKLPEEPVAGEPAPTDVPQAEPAGHESEGAPETPPS